ncbi:hypothetical protein ASG49_08155 [Marmoricola sp. Leaf446]|uniref:hypothetical protein n=1 Tax=Marmoricola sp. Leaf446 TaxID=1736379 RepID=UPI0006F69D8E|nr:hypothetical protein [Marmoricola sp. Leaf446]KQT91956.1 hypothetical protein ASG49_08155 [Marmoricola sp. Leaf446]
MTDDGSPLTLVGASGLAREVVAMLTSGPRPPRLSLIDDSPSRWGTTVAGVPVRSHGLDGLRDPGGRWLVCVGRGSSRRDLVRRLLLSGVRPDAFATVVHPSVEVPPGCLVGPGSIVLAGTVLTTDVELGQHVVVMPHVTLTHDDVVDDFATLCAGVSLGGGVHVAEAGYVGMNACVRERTRVGRDSVLGMGSTLLVDLPDHQTWAGNPARPLPSSHEESSA